MFPSISIGPFVFPTAGLLYLFGAWISLNVVERAAKALNADVNATYATAVAGLIGGLIGARLTHVAFYWSAYSANPLNIIWPLNSGYHLLGGLFFGAATLFFYGRYKNLPPALTADAIAPGLFTALIVVSVADLLAGPGMGTYSRMFWAIEIYGADRHPVQVYEIIGGGLALLAWRQIRPFRSFDGQLFLTTTAVYSGSRLFTEAFRQNGWFTSGGYRVIQIISLATMLASLYALNHFTAKARENANSEN